VQRIFINEFILFMVGSVCRVKLFTTESRNIANVSLMMRLKGGVEMAETTVDFYAAGFDALVK
jgi:hypothetical protein